MNDKMTPNEKEILIDIYGDLAKERGWPWPPNSRQIMKEKKSLPWHVLEGIESFGKDHPKFPLISKLFCAPRKEAEEPADCYKRQDWWTAIVHMLDDSKLFLSENDRKELYLDLSDLIGHRLERKEY